MLEFRVGFLMKLWGLELDILWAATEQTHVVVGRHAVYRVDIIITTITTTE
jgi:hypothetical protein